MMTKARKTFLILIFNALISCSVHNGSYYQGPISDHFDGKRFDSENDQDFFDTLRFSFTPKPTWNNVDKPLELGKIENLPNSEKAKIIFIGHSTFLIQLKNSNILTDPIWSESAGPISFASPSRYVKPAISFDNLPKINYVLISHSSYYHMDVPTIIELKKRFNPQFITGLGNCYYLNVKQKLGVDCAELDWDEKLDLAGIGELYFTKAKHWSKRLFFDYDKTLWGSFIIKNPEIKIFFSGDSGYDDHFKVMGYQYGPFDVALMQMGSYEPRWFLKNHHMNPEEAVMAHKDLKSKKSIGMHFATFRTSTEGYRDPEIDLEKAKLKHEVRKEDFIAPKVGEVFEF